jgi:hypothetical protein
VEALEWVADDVLAADGAATLWQAWLTSRSSEREIIAGMVAARAAGYESLVVRVEAVLATASTTSPAEGLRRLRLLRRELRQIQRRDFFPPPQRQRARAAVEALADHLRQARPGAAVAESKARGS